MLKRFSTLTSAIAWSFVFDSIQNKTTPRSLFKTAIIIAALVLPCKMFAQWTTVGTAGFSTGVAAYTNIAMDPNGTPYVVYVDASNKTTVMKYNGSSWVTVGSASFSAGVAAYTSIAIDASGTPYVVYEDFGNSGNATVMKYNGSSWVNVGAAGFSAGGVIYCDIAIDASGTPYVTYRDGGNSSKVTVMKYNGSSWVNVGSAGFSAGTTGYSSIAIDASGTPYVVYQDNGNSGKVTVMKYNGSSWVNVGSAGFSAGAAIYCDIAIDGNGSPYVTYSDANISNKAVCMKYNGSSWAAVGTAGFSAGTANYLSLAIDRNNTPYITYRDGTISNAATVMRYNGSNWVTYGSTPSAASVLYNALAVGTNGILYLCYRDANSSNYCTVKIYGNLWTGASSTVWGTGGNWSGGSAPTSTDDAVIPYGCTNYPNITSVLTPVCNTLTIDPSASVTVGTSGMLSIYGSITNSGTFTATSGKVKMAGSSAQTIPASTFSSNTIQDLEIANSAGVTLGGSLGLTGTLTPTSGTFTTGGYFTLKSSASGTGRIATGSGSYLSGNVTLERYIPGGRRVFRFIGNPTTSALPMSNLLDDIYITGAGGSTNGFDATQTNNPSAYWYDNTAASSGTWTAITNATTDLNWTSERGLRILVRGDRSQPTTLTGVNPTPNAVTLDITGTIKTGNQDVSLTNANKYHLLANPYASPVDVGTVIAGTSNIGTQYWVWDPQSGTRGAYVTKTKGSSYSIPSMSAFIVLPTGSTTLAFTESNKTAAETGTNSYFRTTNSIPGIGELKLLYNGYPSDNIFIRRDANAASDFDAADGRKLWNPDMNFYMVSTTGDSLSLDSRPFADTVVVPLGFSTAVTTASYAIQLDSWGIDGYDMYLRDKLLNTEQKMNAGDVYNFTTTVANPGVSRFEIVLRPSAILPLSALQLTAQQKGNNIQLRWNITGEETAVRYELEYSRDGRSFEKLTSQNANGTKSYSWLHSSISGTTHYYRIKNIVANGSASYSAVVKVNTAKTNASISIYPNPVKKGNPINISLNNLEKGTYIIRLVDAIGKITLQKQIDHSGGNATETITAASIPAGTYTIALENGVSKFISQLIIR